MRPSSTTSSYAAAALYTEEDSFYTPRHEGYRHDTVHHPYATAASGASPLLSSAHQRCLYLERRPSIQPLWFHSPLATASIAAGSATGGVASDL